LNAPLENKKIPENKALQVNVRAADTARYSLADAGGMKFNSEIIRDDGGVVHRMSVHEMSPRRAKTKAAALVDLYSGRGATGARISNDKDEELYKLQAGRGSLVRYRTDARQGTFKGAQSGTSDVIARRPAPHD
jgi:hypothetical protein